MGETELNDRYTILSKLGRGAYSTVWRVFDKKMKTFSALKIAKSGENCAQAARNELRLLQGLKDERIIELQDYFQYSPTGNLCIVLSEASGNLLDLKHAYATGLPEPLLKRLVEHTLEGARYLHARQIIHTDIKPENILVDRMDSPAEMAFSFKICDLGSACSTAQRHANCLLQTLNYRSPEIILNYPDYNEKIDIWSLACVYFELSTGEYLFDPCVTASFTCAQDHIAQIMELVNAPIPTYLYGSGAKEILESTTIVRNIPVLKPWPLNQVFQEKYGFPVQKAATFAAFLNPLLALDFHTRLSAAEGLTKMKLLLD
jgi:serine/threonine protein kinase